MDEKNEKKTESSCGKTQNPISLKDVKSVKALDGIFRRTLAYNEETMLCHFDMKKGAKIPLHDHIHVQIGYVIKGKIKFFTENGEFIASAGDSYVFDSNEKHGAELLEDSEVIEVFSPCRSEYK
ncbi:MAG: cupin domain-containing protein [Promethearchaeota archaeon]